MHYAVWASRQMAPVSFTLLNSRHHEDMVPFTAIVPSDVSAVMVRFVHKHNGKSVVAHVVKRLGEQYITNPELASALGISSSEARVYIEAVH